MVRFEDAIPRYEQDVEIAAKRNSSFALQLRPIPIQPRNIDFFGRLPYLPEPYSSLWEDADRYSSQLRENAQAEHEAGFADRNRDRLALRDEFSSSDRAPTIEEEKARIMALKA